MTRPADAQPAPPVHLWYTRCGAATASALAIRQNWLQAEFAQGGTVLHSLRESDSVELRNAHFHHGQTGLFREGGNIPPIWAKASGQDTVVVAITWLDEYQGVLVREDSDIRTPADLAGKRLAVPRHREALIDFQRGAAQHGYTSALKLAQLSAADAVLVDIDTPRPAPAATAETPPRSAVVEALQQGRVDAAFVRFASGYRLSRQPGVRELVNLGAHPDPLLRVNNGTPRPVTVDRAFLQKHPDVVARYLAVLLRTAAWAERHPQEVLQLLVPESGGDGIEDVIASHGENVHRSFTPTLSPASIAGLAAQKDFLRDWGYLKADFELAQWIDPAPLAEARRLFAQQPEPTEFPAAALAA